ncbi:DUF6168 family protein [Urechidicola croceus]|uniref:Uncharacterized protein n=1 Tax=Urechidicola croceus TaxID=1850246 RepID=A0A1D8P908_9FLAO|nr:hypothetical protein LPB138_10335 [Urechidicola croceus]
MAKSIFKYILISFFLLILIFLIHTKILSCNNHSPYSNQIILTYLFNFIVAVLIILGLYIVRKKHKDNLGYLFMAGSLLKFVLFFILFYPIYKSDGEMSKIEFFTFFIPYFSCLIIETLTLIKLLKFLDSNPS